MHVNVTKVGYVLQSIHMHVSANGKINSMAIRSKICLHTSQFSTWQALTGRNPKGVEQVQNLHSLDLRTLAKKNIMWKIWTPTTLELWANLVHIHNQKMNRCTVEIDKKCKLWHMAVPKQNTCKQLQPWTLDFCSGTSRQDSICGCDSIGEPTPNRCCCIACEIHALSMDSTFFFFKLRKHAKITFYSMPNKLRQLCCTMLASIASWHLVPCQYVGCAYHNLVVESWQISGFVDADMLGSQWGGLLFHLNKYSKQIIFVKLGNIDMILMILEILQTLQLKMLKQMTRSNFVWICFE